MNVLTVDGCDDEIRQQFADETCPGCPACDTATLIEQCTGMTCWCMKDGHDDDVYPA